MRNLSIFFIVFIGSGLLALSCHRDENKNQEKPAFNLSNMDATVNPGDDFFQYVNGGWLKSNPIPGDLTSYGAFQELMEANKVALRTLVEEAAGDTSAPQGSVRQKIREFYNSGMDSLAIEQDGIQPLSLDFDRINQVNTFKDVQAVSEYFMKFGISPMFGVFSDQDLSNSSKIIAWFWQGGIGLPDRDYYTNDDARSRDIRAEYVKYMASMFEMIGYEKNIAFANAEKVMRIETQFARISNTQTENQDPAVFFNKMNWEQLSQMCPSYDWKSFAQNLGISDVKEFAIGQPGFFSGMDKILKKVSIEDWKLLLKWRLLNTMGPYLNYAIVNRQFEFYQKFLSGQQTMSPRWKDVVNELNNDLGEILGQLYVEKYFPPRAKDRMTQMCNNLINAMKVRIENLTWMSPETRKAALAKLANMKFKIGYPNTWKDYSELIIVKDSYVKNVMSANAFHFAYKMSKIGKPVDHSEWDMTPQTVNAGYYPSLNEFVFPAGILQPPFFDMNADDAINYGAIGAIIGHEMTHGFDNNGCKYDKDGNLKNWWRAEDAMEFEKRSQILVNQFDAQVAIDTCKLDGKLTLSENIADLGGLTIAYQAFQMTSEASDQSVLIDGFTPNQRFFLGWAQGWRENIRDKSLLRQIQEDVHSPAKFRVNVSIFNLDAFYQAFPNIKQDDKLFRLPEMRPVIW